MSCEPWDPKDPEEDRPYRVDWADDLDEGDTIATSTWTLSGTGLEQHAAAHDEKSTLVWLRLGTSGTTYQVRNKVVTANGQTLIFVVPLLVQTK